MTDPDFYMTMAASGLLALGMLTGAGLSGWRGWLQLQREARAQVHDAVPGGVGAGARIEIADLRERIRKLEAIAAGVDL